MDTLRINRISLDNIGPFTSLDVRFPEKEGLNLVCGDNGIGKTTLLDSIVAAFSQGRLDRLKRRAGSDKGEIQLDCLINGKNASPKIKITAFEPDQRDIVQGIHNYALSIINIKAARDFSYSKQDSISRDPAFNPSVFGQRVGNGLDSNEIKSWFSNRYLLKPHAESASWTPQMIQNLSFAESFFSLLDPKVKLDRVDIRTFDIIVSTPSGLIPFEYLSSGFRSAYILLLGILKEIEFRGLNVSAKDFSGVIIIDELDLHLHPIWQREIGGALKKAFPSAQIIASTHSPHVIQAAQSSEVVALVRNSDGDVYSREVPSTKYGYAGWTLEEVLEDIMGMEDTKTPIFRDAMRDFDRAIDNDDARAVAASLAVLEEMLHANNPLRKLISIQAAPYAGGDAE